jgi:hypothetical protein
MGKSIGDHPLVRRAGKLSQQLRARAGGGADGSKGDMLCCVLRRTEDEHDGGAGWADCGVWCRHNRLRVRGRGGVETKRWKGRGTGALRDGGVMSCSKQRWDASE